MKKIIVILISIFLLVLDNSLLPNYPIFGSYPNFLFIFAIAYSIVYGKKEAVFIGVITGILQDIYFIKGFGINSLSNLLLCFLAAKIGGNILKKNKLAPVLSVFILSIIKGIFVAIILMLFNQSVNYIAAILSALYNSIIMIIVYNIVLATCDKYMDSDRWRFK
ncbi:MAG: rod shape-determining protein MreD [Clostridium sp.]|nr:rod shape-determining protein MreD [Clostridium sp.]